MSGNGGRAEFVTEQQVNDYKVLYPLLKSMYDEFQELSKKKPQDIVSKGKVTVVNRILTPVLALLQDEPSRQFLELLDDDDLPENSDVVLMLGQAITALRSFQSHYADGRTGWKISR